MKLIILIMSIFAALGNANCQLINNAIVINKYNEVKETYDGGRTWYSPGLKYISDKPKNLNSTAIFNKLGTKLTTDGGKTWHIIGNDKIEAKVNCLDIALYPNPVVNNTLNISISNLSINADISVIVTDLSCNLFFKSNFNAGTTGLDAIKLNLKDLANGSYFLIVQYNNNVITKLFQKL